jgi:large repetitive protein
MKRLSGSAVTILCSLLLASCGGGGSASQPVTQPPPPVTVSLTIGPNTLPNAPKDAYYQFTDFTVQGGTMPYTFSATGQLPPGMTFVNSLNPNTGVLKGTPTATGTYNFTVNVTDSANHSGSKGYSLTVDTQLVITTTTLPAGVNGLAYDQPVNSVNGIAPLTWTALPTAISPGQVGLTLNAATGRLQGTISQFGNFNLDVQVTDSSVPARTVHKVISLESVAPLTFPFGSVITLHRDIPSNSVIGLVGGVTPIQLAIINGALPPGTVFTGTAIVGSPVQVGNFPVTFQATDSFANGPEVVSKAMTISVQEKFPTIVNQQVPRAVVGKPYDFYFAVDGGARPFTWNPISLPSGLTFDSVQGRITGTPTQSGLVTLFLRLEDSSSPTQSASAVYDFFIINPPTGRNDSIATATPVSNGNFGATISPFVNAQGIEAPDTDYYIATANGGSVVTVAATAAGVGFGFPLMDPVVEIVNASGQRLTTCRNQGSTDGVTGAPDPTPNAFDDICLNDDITLGQNVNSFLEMQVPAGPPQTFYIHVADFRGDARPEMRYSLSVSGVN